MIGQILFQYRILSKLGAGGLDDLHEADDTQHGRRVASKILPEGFAANPDNPERFQREARALAALFDDRRRSPDRRRATFDLVKPRIGDLLPAGWEAGRKKVTGEQEKPCQN